MSSWFRVLTLNAHQGFRAGFRREVLLRMRDALRRSGADLVFLQEIGAASVPVPEERQYEVLADGVWTSHAYGQNAAVSGGHHGNALLSRYPIVSWRNVDASVGKAESRGFLHVVVELAGLRRSLHAVCVHLALRESHRRRQVARLLELLATDVPADAPLLVAGDFNDWREHAHRALAEIGGLVEVHAASTGRPARTFPARLPVLRLDRIYVRHLKHRPFPMREVEWSRLSDHAPLAADIAPVDNGG